MADTYLVGGGKFGMDVRIASPRSLWPTDEVMDSAREAAEATGGKVTVTEDVAEAVNGCDFLATDVWVSMGEPEDVWRERIALLKPYQVNAEVMRMTGNPDTKFMHCLPAFHDADVGKEIFDKVRARRARGHGGGVRVAGIDRVGRGGEPDAHDQGRDGRDHRELTCGSLLHWAATRCSDVGSR